MKTYLYLILSLYSGIQVYAQHTLSVFDNLVDKTWRTDTNWENENSFFQEISFEYALDSSLVLTKTKGHIDQEQVKIGDRNFGVRQFDKTKQHIYFVEYDIFGGKTEGTVRVDGMNLIYTYIYGDVELTEQWIYVNSTTYTYKIGVWKEDKWDTVFLESQFIQVH